MFGISSSLLQSQTLLPISSVISQYTSARPSTTRVTASVKKVSNVSKSDNGAECATKSEAKEVSECSLNKLEDMSNALTEKLLADFALMGAMPQAQSFNSNMQIRNFSQVLRKRPSWHESHISYNSFTENKNGFPSQFSQPSSDTILARILNGRKSENIVLSVLFGTYSRGFKTIKSLERDTKKNPSAADRLMQSLNFKEPSVAFDADAKQKLNALINSEGASEEGVKNVKIAFAEGYLAASDQKKPTSRFMTMLQNFQKIVVFISLIAIIFAVWGTLSGSLRFRMQGMNGKEVSPEEVNVSFNDVKGVEEAKQELQEIVEFLKNPDKFTALGAELLKGALLVGPPGTGKTLLARAVAGEAGVPFFHAAGPEFDEILVGQGARRVRDLFRAAKARAPCVVFIDEIDSVGAKRSNTVLHPYANQTINQLLSEMDGFSKNEGVIVLGATNRRDDLDKALLRPGRFDVEVQVPVPDLAGRKAIFDYYLEKVKVGTDVEVAVLGRGTTGFTGADIKNVVNQAALRAAADHMGAVSMKHLEEARDKVLMGPEKSRIPDDETNLLTAYHEGGHTLVAFYTKDSDPLHKVTIIPRGHSLGHTAYIPAKEEYHKTRSQILAMMDCLMGGRAAEEIVFGGDNMTTGASSDLKQATNLASHLVKDLGMSDKVGLRTFEAPSNNLLQPGESLGHTTKELIDGEIKRILQESYERAKTILRTHSKEHKMIAEALMKYETLDANDIKSILEGRPVSKDL